MKKTHVLLLSIILVFLLDSCTKDGVKNQIQEENQIELFTPYKKPIAFDSLSVANTLKINFAMGNIYKTMTYQHKKSLELPDGTTITQGDLKPTWQYIQKTLGITIVDATIQDQSAGTMINAEKKAGFTDATIFGGNSCAEKLMNYGAQGYFINLKKYLKYMPNLTRYLNNNPDIAKAITAYDGGIYHLPYVAEINNYARVVNARSNWITGLLDSTTNLVTETDTLTVAYNGYWNRNPTNVIDLQNKASQGGRLNQKTALSVLKRYISTTYPNLSKPSDLYLGETAQYDMDELIALWRVIKLSPNTLSKITTGKVVSGAKITPYFVRKGSYKNEVLRLVTFFDGEKCHSTDSSSASACLYTTDDDKMVFSYANKSFLQKVEYLKQIYSEGLICKTFASAPDKTDFRKNLFFSDTNEGQKEFGFMTMDWITSTTNGNDKIQCMLPPVTTITGAGITQFIHYLENTRSIKPDGWAISAAADEQARNAALMLFDYMFSEEGQTIQNYSVPAAWATGELYTGLDGTEYPKFNSWIINKSNELLNGDIASFLRDYMGSQISLGYQKNMGVELQLTNGNGKKGLELYTKMNVLTMSYDSPVTYLRLMPPIISLTESDMAEFKGTSIDSDTIDIVFDYIAGTNKSLRSTQDIINIFKKAGIDKYLAVYKTAYKRMMED